MGTIAAQLSPYRLKTAISSFRTLYRLPPNRVDAFINAYKMYDCDWANEPELIEAMGADYYSAIRENLVSYYSVVNHLCAIGEVEKMYIPPAIDLTVGILANQLLYEKYVSLELGMKKGDRVLDLGCGRGRVASHMAAISGAKVTGVNIDPGQLDSAREFAKRHGLADQCDFLQADFNDLPLPFPDNHFDAFCDFQVFSLVKDMPALLRELQRILKPGAKLCLLEWVRLDKYDPNNPHHASLMKRVKPLIGAIGTPSPDDLTDLLKAAGFAILKTGDASVGGHQAPLIEKADDFFNGVARLVKLLVRVRVLPPHFQALFDRLTKDGKALIEADRLGIVTTSYQIIAQKPEETYN